jgi:hypothetical protein
MGFDSRQPPPYIDWPLDRWKVGVILLIFSGLLLSSLAYPTDEAALGQAMLRATLPAAAPIALGVTPDPTSTAPSSPLLPQTTPPPGLTATPTPPASTPVAPVAEPTAGLPLLLANLPPNALVPAESVRVLFGSAAPNSVVEVRDQAMAPVADSDLSPGAPQESILGVVMAGADGLWQLGPFEPLPPGQHVLTLFQLDEEGAIEAVSSPVVVTVLASGEQGPLSLASPTIRFPTLGTRLRSGPVTFVGAALPGMMVRLYLDNRQVAEGIVSAREEWRLTPEEPLAPGVYVARVAAMNPQGAIIAESAPTVFWVEEMPLSSRSHCRCPRLRCR